MNRQGRVTWLRVLMLATLLVVQGSPGRAQVPDNPSPGDDADAPPAVSVQERASDAEIAGRLTGILEATEWFTAPAVRVEEGVVFIEGEANSEKHREWAARLAINTEDVVAVVNRLEVAEPVVKDLSPAWDKLRKIGKDAVRNLPLILLAIVLLVVSWFLAAWTRRGTAALFRRRMKSQLLTNVLSRALSVPVFLLGLYVVLNLSGLTGLAATVIGGTGLLGLVIGFAFRDIAENFLASILLSMQRPFATGDLVEVGGFKGFVQSVNTRSTLMMTMEGNHVQIPNATIYKEPIKNFTANPYERFDFVAGVGYDAAISEAQAVALDVLQEHPAVENDPEPLVLAEALGAATINLRVYFWVDISKHSGPKVRSAVIRLVKTAFEQAQISMPDEAREVVFPAGVPVRMLGDEEQIRPTAAAPGSGPPASSPDEALHEATQAEGGLTTEAGEIEAQARKARNPESGTNLLAE